MTYDKSRNEKKQLFLDAALELFYEKGYEKTTINDIINKLGVSKGAFYHYFQSKEDVIETIAEEYTEKMTYIVKNIVNRKDIDAIEKFNLSIEMAQDFKKRESEKRAKIKGSLRNEENLKLQKKIMSKISYRFKTLYESIILEGIEQQLFNISYSREMPGFFLQIAHGLNESIDELITKAREENIKKEDLIREVDEKLAFYEEVFGRILNLNGKSIKIREAYLRGL